MLMMIQKTTDSVLDVERYLVKNSMKAKFGFIAIDVNKGFALSVTSCLKIMFLKSSSVLNVHRDTTSV